MAAHHFNSRPSGRSVVIPPAVFESTQKRALRRANRRPAGATGQPISINVKPTLDAIKGLSMVIANGELSTEERAAIGSEIARYRNAVRENVYLTIEDCAVMDVCRKVQKQISERISKSKDRSVHLEREAAYAGHPSQDSDLRTPINALAHFAVDLTNAARDPALELRRLFELFYRFGAQGRLPSFEELHASGKYDGSVPGYELPISS